MSPTTRFKDALKRAVPNPILFRLSPHAVRNYVRIKTWYTCGRHYAAPIDPFALIAIEPERVETGMCKDADRHFSYSNAIPEVKAGDWDREIRSIAEFDIYETFQRRFLDCEPWDRTPFYERMSRQIDRGRTKWGCETLHDFEERLAVLDELYAAIDEYGYKTQTELRRAGDAVATRDIHKYWPPELHEVTVNIDRAGELIFHDGRHRLFIAKVAGVDKIPVRVKVRHEEWQRRRDERYPQPGGAHPDLTGERVIPR